MDSGFIKLYRRFKDWEWYDDVNTSRVFIHLLLSANYKPTKYRGHVIPAGSVVTGYPSLADQTGLSVRNVRTAISHLKKTGELTVQVAGKFSIISITKWATYNGTDEAGGRQGGRQAAGRRQGGGRQVATSKEGKKERSKEGKKEESRDAPSPKSPPPKRGKRLDVDALPDDWREFCNMERPDLNAIKVFERFHDYWIAQPGQKGVKLDWDATWRNWVRNEKKGTMPGRQSPDIDLDEMQRRIDSGAGFWGERALKAIEGAK